MLEPEVLLQHALEQDARTLQPRPTSSGDLLALLAGSDLVVVVHVDVEDQVALRGEDLVVGG